MAAALSPKLLSIMLSSRGRFAKLLETLESFKRQLTPEQRGLVELVIKFDSDDLESVSRIPELPHADFTSYVLVSQRLGGYRDLWIHANHTARLTRGRYILGWNDDAVFTTDDWFSIFQAQAARDQSAFSYWFGGTSNEVLRPGLPPTREDWPCFIAHHRLFYEIMGFYGDVGGVDSFLYYVLGPLNLLKKIEAIQISHVPWFQIPPEERDEISRANSQPGQMLPNRSEVIRACQEKIVRYATNQRAPAGAAAP